MDSLTIARGLKALGYTEFAVQGNRIVGIEDPPKMPEIVAAANALEKRRRERVQRADVIDELAKKAAKDPNVSARIKKYVDDLPSE